MTIRRAAIRILLIPLWMLLAALGGAFLLRHAPGAASDERELDGRFSGESLAALRRDMGPDYYRRFLAGLANGDLGRSQTLGRPVSELVAERAGVTARLVAGGVVLAWVASLAVSGAWLWTGIRAFDLAGVAAGSLLLSIPAAVVGIAFLHWRAPAPLGLALILFPRLYAYLHHSFGQIRRKPHVMLAVAKGLQRGAIAWRHIIPHATPALASLAALSVSLGLGAAVPLEVLCDQPGIGQLAWQAAVARDLPVLVGLTLLIALVTLAANTAGDLAAEAFSARFGGRR